MFKYQFRLNILMVGRHTEKNIPSKETSSKESSKDFPKESIPKREKASPSKEKIIPKEKEDLHHVEKSLFSDVSVDDDQDDDQDINSDSIGLLSKPRKEKETASQVDEKQITFKFHPGKIKQYIKRGLFWLVIAVLVMSFFFNPLYCYFPWNYNLCYGEQTSEDGEAADEDAALDIEEETSPDTEETAEEEASEEPAAPKKSSAKVEEPAVEESTDTTDTDSDDSSISTAPRSTINLTITNVEIIKTNYGAKIGKVMFTVDNNKETFIGKARVRGFNNKIKQEVRSDKFLVLGELSIGHKYEEVISLDAQYDKAGEKLVVLELFDEGGETGSAKDRRMASVEKVVQVG